jgi:uncharacterized small protein (DUF1192 family)
VEVPAQTPEATNAASASQVEVDELRRQIDALQQEIDRLKKGG